MSDVSTNAERYRGSLVDYDNFRPGPPSILVETLSREASIARPKLVVDLGCGTGLSTRFWSNKAERVIGIDPSAEMLAVAQSKAPSNVAHKQGFSHATGIETGAADVVTCCQSLHWMAPDETIAEVARILRPGGAWLIADYDLPQIHQEIDAALEACLQKAKAMSVRLQLEKEQKCWTDDQRQRIEASQNFKLVREFHADAADSGNAARLMGFVRSLGTIQMPLQRCNSESELGLDRLSLVAERLMRGGALPWNWRYHVIVAMK